jgi:hypothetical protein
MHESARPSRRRSRAKLMVRGERPCPLSLSHTPGEQAAHAPKDARLARFRHEWHPKEGVRWAIYTRKSTEYNLEFDAHRFFETSRPL